MKRRDFLKCAAGVSAMAMCSYPDRLGAGQAPQTTRVDGPVGSGRQAPVYLAGAEPGGVRTGDQSGCPRRGPGGHRFFLAVPRAIRSSLSLPSIRAILIPSRRARLPSLRWSSS